MSLRILFVAMSLVCWGCGAKDSGKDSSKAPSEEEQDPKQGNSPEQGEPGTEPGPGPKPSDEEASLSEAGYKKVFSVEKDSSHIGFSTGVIKVADFKSAAVHVWADGLSTRIGNDQFIAKCYLSVPWKDQKGNSGVRKEKLGWEDIRIRFFFAAETGGRMLPKTGEYTLTDGILELASLPGEEMMAVVTNFSTVIKPQDPPQSSQDSETPGVVDEYDLCEGKINLLFVGMK